MIDLQYFFCEPEWLLNKEVEGTHSISLIEQNNTDLFVGCYLEINLIHCGSYLE